MNDRKKVYYFKKKEIPYFIAYFLMAFSNVVIANSYLFGENRYDICVFVQYISCILFIVALCTGKYKLRDLIVRGLIGIIVIFITINLRSTEFGVYSLAIIASLNIDSKRIVRFNVISNFILFKYPLYGVGSYISIILVGKFAKKGKNCIDN